MEREGSWRCLSWEEVNGMVYCMIVAMLDFIANSGIRQS